MSALVDSNFAGAGKQAGLELWRIGKLYYHAHKIRRTISVHY